MSSTHTFTFTRAHTATFASDAMRNVLRDIVRALGLDPVRLINGWSLNGLAARTWLQSGHLRVLILEFYKPGSSRVEGRIDLPVSYGGSGVDDDMWVDRDHIRRSVAKIGKLPSSCLYDVVFQIAPGAPYVEGMGDVDLRDTSGLTSLSAGSVISTPDIVAGLRYWR